VTTTQSAGCVKTSFLGLSSVVLEPDCGNGDRDLMNRTSRAVSRRHIHQQLSFIIILHSVGTHCWLYGQPLDVRVREPVGVGPEPDLRAYVKSCQGIGLGGQGACLPGRVMFDQYGALWGNNACRLQEVFRSSYEMQFY